MAFKDKIETGTKILATASTALALYERGLDRYYNRKQKEFYSVTISSEEGFYFPIAKWATSQLSESDQKSIRMVRRDNERHFIHNGSLTHKFTVDGYEISFVLDSSNGNSSEDFGGGEILLMSKKPELVFTTKTLEGKKYLEKKLKSLVDEYFTSLSPPKILVQNGKYWDSGQELPRRSLKSVVLKDGLMENLTEDIDKFIADEARYEDLGMPYHRGYLFYGPPGTGKTSLVKAIARHYDKDVYYLSLSDIDSDADLSLFIMKVQTDGILLIEDVDVFNAASSREEVKDSVTLAGPPSQS